jgi:hypothetical protein
MRLLSRCWQCALLFLAVSLSASAGRFDFPIACEETVEALAKVEKIEKRAAEIHEDPDFIQSLEVARKELWKLYADETGTPNPVEEKATAKNIVDFLRSRPLEEAIARTFFEFEKDSPKSVQETLQQIRKLPMEHRLHFAESVIERLDQTIEGAISLLDRDLDQQLVERWGAKDRKEVLELVDDYDLMQENGGADLRIALLHYFAFANPDEIHQEILKIRAPKPKKLSVEETLLKRHIDSPFTDADLAQNKTPVSEEEFERTMRRLELRGKYELVAAKIKNPNIAGAMVGISAIPPLVVKVATGSWDGLTNIVATLMGGIGTSPLLLSVFQHPEKEIRVYWWIQALNVSQIDRLVEFAKIHPRTAKAVQLDAAMPLVLRRQGELRKIRYGRRSAVKVSAR